MPKAVLSAARARELFNYNPTTGDLTWRSRPSRKNIPKGAIAGTLRKDRYRQVKVDGVLYLCHRVAHLIVNGVWPEGVIDHEGRDPSDNRWQNLHDVCTSKNLENQAEPRRNNRLGLLGVSLHKASGLYRSKIVVQGKLISLGYFTDPEPAHIAYLLAKFESHHPFNLKKE